MTFTKADALRNATPDQLAARLRSIARNMHRMSPGDSEYLHQSELTLNVAADRLESIYAKLRLLGGRS